MAKPKTKYEHLNIRVKEKWKTNLKEEAEKVNEDMTEYVEKSVEMRISGNGKEKKA